MKCAGYCARLWPSHIGLPAARLGAASSLLASPCLDSVFWGSLYMHMLSTRAVLLFHISYIYGSHHTITSMLKYIHSSAQTHQQKWQNITWKYIIRNCLGSLAITTFSVGQYKVIYLTKSWNGLAELYSLAVVYHLVLDFFWDVIKYMP